MRLTLSALLLAACTSATAEAPTTQPAAGAPAASATPASAAAPELEARVASGALKAAVFAGGCFWCMEGPFERTPGVLSVVSGYAGGPEPNPTYEQVGTGRTGHAEAVRVVYDPARTSFAALLEVYWHNVDPTQRDGQFCDEGRQYRTAIFFSDEAERATATASKAAREASRKAATSPFARASSARCTSGRTRSAAGSDSWSCSQPASVNVMVNDSSPPSAQNFWPSFTGAGETAGGDAGAGATGFRGSPGAGASASSGGGESGGGANASSVSTWLTPTAPSAATNASRVHSARVM